MIIELIAIGLIISQYVYHRLTEVDPPAPSDRLQVPKVDEGQTPPMFFGRVRIEKPFVAWHGNATAALSGTSPTGLVFNIDILFVAGIPFFDGSTHLRNVYFGDEHNVTSFDLPPNLGNVWGPFEPQPLDEDDSEFLQALVEFGDGVSTQNMGLGTLARAKMILAGIPESTIPGYRGYATAFMEVTKFTQRLPDIDLEVSSYPNSPYYVSYVPLRVGEEANPADVIAALLCDQFGKLGQSPLDILDQSSFKNTGETLAAEGHGYSHCWDSRAESREIINDVLKQIDAVLYQNQNTGRWHLRLIRADYDANNLRDLTPSNCRIDGFAAGGWVDTPNSIRIVFSDRADNYRDNSAVAQRQANAVGQNGEVIEQVLNFPGCKTMALAEKIASRELAWRSKPLVKCQAIASRGFIDIAQGDVLRLTYPDLNIGGRVMRVAAVSYGSGSTNNVVMDLLEDAFYVYRRRAHVGGEAGFPGPPIAY